MPVTSTLDIVPLLFVFLIKLSRKNRHFDQTEHSGQNTHAHKFILAFSKPIFGDVLVQGAKLKHQYLHRCCAEHLPFKSQAPLIHQVNMAT